MAFYDEGNYDPLTGLMAPVHFYESSERLLSWAERSHHPVSIIAMRLSAINEDDLVRCARHISSELRGGDLLARISAYDFALLFLGDSLGAEQLIFRLRNTIKASIGYEHTQIEVGESVVDGLARLNI